MLRLIKVSLYKLIRNPMMKLINQNSWVQLLMTNNWLDRSYIMWVERSLVVSELRSRLGKYSTVNLWNVCITDSYILIWFIVNQVWGFVCKTNIEPLFISQKKAVKIICCVHPRSLSGPFFITMNFVNYENTFRYLIGRVMHCHSKTQN